MPAADLNSYSPPTRVRADAKNGAGMLCRRSRALFGAALLHIGPYQTEFYLSLSSAVKCRLIRLQYVAWHKYTPAPGAGTPHHANHDGIRINVPGKDQIILNRQLKQKAVKNISPTAFRLVKI